MKNTFTALFLLISLNTFAHEGHNKTPGSFKTLYGGTISVGKEINLEVINNGLEFTVYPLTHESQDVPSNELKIEAKAKPKKRKAYPISLTALKKGFSAKVDLKGDNRLPIEITTNYKNKKDVFEIQIEE